jgi:hypothetical protein
MRIAPRFTVVGFMLAASAATGLAGQFSFDGIFSKDNDIQLFTFSLLSANTVTLQTWSYGGGTNANGLTISPGGFEPVFQVYNAVSGAGLGTFIPGTDSSCPPNIADPSRPLHLCYDLFAQTSLAAGNYLLALAQNPNLPIGDNSFNAGFQYDSDPNFNGGFVGTFGYPGDGHWAVDILFVDAAGVTAVPEPSSAALTAVVALLAVLGSRRMRPKAEPESQTGAPSH